MTKSMRVRYTLEFKQEAARLVESGQSQTAVARSLGVVEQTLRNLCTSPNPALCLDKMIHRG
jgi:transposase